MKKKSKSKINTKKLSSSIAPISKEPSISHLDLPIKEIKTDLLGIVLFSLFAIAFIFALNHYNVTLDLIFEYIASLR